MNYNIEIDIINRGIKITNKESNLIDVHFTDYEKNFGIYKCGLRKNMWGMAYIPETTKTCYMYVCDDNLSIDVYEILLLNETYTINKKDSLENFNFNSPFVFVGGHTGGGTSIFVKALRSLGIHFGDDCGDFSNRKPHESVSMKVLMYSLKENLTIHQEKKKFLDVAGVYNYLDNEINCFKVPGDEKNKVNENIKRLCDIFPNIKILSVIRKRNNFYSTNEGKNFNHKTDENVLLEQLFMLEGASIFHVDFYKFFTDYNYFNKVLKYIGYPDLLQNQEQLEFIKQKINFDERVLK